MTNIRPISFNLGQVVITPNAKEAIPTYDIIAGLTRHQRGDWGIVSDADKEANYLAIESDDSILSAYMSGETEFWIITECDRSATTILLPDEY